MEPLGDLSSYNAAATLRVSKILNSLDNQLYNCSESTSATSGADDARSRSTRNPLLLMFRQVETACDNSHLKQSLSFAILHTASHPALILPLFLFRSSGHAFIRECAAWNAGVDLAAPHPLHIHCFSHARFTVPLLHLHDLKVAPQLSRI